MLSELLAGNPHLPWEMVLTRLSGATVLCALIGLEREINRHAAGLRTNMLIGLGTATFALVTQYMISAYAQAGESVRMDPLRMIEAATAGVAFLAAGTIVLSRGQVTGLTTGALMWVSAAVGLCSGFGLWVLAVPATVLALAITVFIAWLEPD
jgi:putative Mg2+ transporter-C (MgtC) family protein